MAQFQVLYWRDIPTQIKVRGDGGRLSAQLPESFQTFIDRIAMREGSLRRGWHEDGVDPGKCGLYGPRRQSRRLSGQSLSAADDR